MNKLIKVENRIFKEGYSTTLEMEFGENLGITMIGKKSVISAQLDKEEMILLRDWLSENIDK